MIFDWAQLSDEEVLERLRSAPSAFGPWERDTDPSNGVWYHRTLPSGCPWMFVHQEVADGMWATAPKKLGEYGTPEAAMEAYDAFLRAQGARLVGPSKVPT